MPSLSTEPPNPPTAPYEAWTRSPSPVLRISPKSITELSPSRRLLRRMLALPVLPWNQSSAAMPKRMLPSSWKSSLEQPVLAATLFCSTLLRSSWLPISLPRFLRESIWLLEPSIPERLQISSSFSAAKSDIALRLAGEYNSCYAKQGAQRYVLVSTSAVRLRCHHGHHGARIAWLPHRSQSRRRSRNRRPFPVNLRNYRSRPAD